MDRVVVETCWFEFWSGSAFGVNFCHACQRVTNKISGEQAGRAFHANSFLWNLPQTTSGDDEKKMGWSFPQLAVA